MLASIGLLGSFALTGCGINTEELAGETTAAIPGRVIQGHVHGGVYPIRGATIKLMQTVTIAGNTPTAPNATTYVTPGNSYGAQAQLLLTTSSDQNGYFTFPDTGWSCASNEFAYLVVTGGHTSNLNTTNANNNVVQVGVIGPCASLSTQAKIDAVNVFVSELSTVAAAAALGNFMSISPNDASGNQVVNIGAPLLNSITASCTSPSPTMTCKAAGLAHAFTNAATLVDSVRTNGTFPTGQANFQNANSYVSSTNSNASWISAPLINTIGNILQRCVDSLGNDGPCSNLFSAATVAGATSPAVNVPANTLQVVLNMMKFPTTNISGLFGQIAPNVPFTPALANAPTAFAVSIFYGANQTGSTIPYPIDLALDNADNAYVLYTDYTITHPKTYSAVNEWTANGQLAFTGAPNNTYLNPSQIALDVSGTVYVTNNNTGNTANDAVLELSPTSGTAPATLYPLASLPGASGIATDASGDVFVSSINASTASVTEYTQGSLSTALTTAKANPGTVGGAAVRSSSQSFGAVYGLAVDASQNVWGTGQNSSGVVGLFLWTKPSNPTNPYASTNSSATAFSNVSAPFSVSLNSAGKAYFPFNADLASATYISSTLNANSAVASASGSTVPDRSEADGAGNVFWTDRESTGQLYRYIPGASTPVTSFLPCFAFQDSTGAFNCVTTSTGTNAVYTPANLRGLAIDSAGDLWYAADAGYGAVIETLGVAAPTWPLLAYPRPGCPGATMAACP